MKFIAYYDSPLGKITLAGDEAGLCGLWFEGEKYYAHALAMGSTDGKFCARDIATKTDTAAREGCYEKSCTLEANGAANEKRGSADLLAKEQYGASETQRDFAALKKSEKSDFAAKAANGADGKFCAHTLIASEKFFTNDFAAQDASEKPRVTNLSAQGASGKFDTVDFSVKISNDAGKKFDTNSLVARFKNLPVQTEPKYGADVLAANALITDF